MARERQAEDRVTPAPPADDDEHGEFDPPPPPLLTHVTPEDYDA